MASTTQSEAPKAKRSPVQEITVNTDTRDILARAKKDADHLNFKDYFIVDVDSHIVETDNWIEVLEYIDDPVMRYNGMIMSELWPVSRKMALHCEPAGLMFQDVQGRIPHQASLAEPVDDKSVHRDVTLVRRAIETFGFDYQIVFPQPLLEIGLHPRQDIADMLTEAFNRWFMEKIIPKDKRMLTQLPLPFSNPELCLKTIKQYGDHPQVVGFMVTSQREVAVHDNKYMAVYRELEERGLPIGFHAGPTQTDQMTKTMNRFISAHAMSFVTCNMGHMTNWIMNGLPERFPKLKVIFIESGLAWIPFMMQRLDTEFLKRPSDAPQLKRLPSEYIKEMHFTSQPLEDANLEYLEFTMKMMNAETQLLYSSDWPHWDFDLPSAYFGYDFVTDKMRRNILGENARRVFNLPK